MKAEDLINNNALTNIEVTGRDTVVYTGIALTAINMARMEERENVLKWISVKERLPDPGEEVLLFEEGSPRPFEIGWLREKQGDHKSNWALQNGNVVFEVTYWMPIPKLP